MFPFRSLDPQLPRNCSILRLGDDFVTVRAGTGPRGKAGRAIMGDQRAAECQETTGGEVAGLADTEAERFCRFLATLAPSTVQASDDS